MKFIIILFFWFLSSFLFPYNSSFYNSLNKPFFTPPNILFSVMWTIIYILISISIYKIYKNHFYKTIKSYNKALIINYFFNFLFPFVFFKLQNTFLGFIFSLGSFISSLFLYYETNELDENAAKYLNLYLIWGFFAVLLSLTIYLMNFQLDLKFL